MDTTIKLELTREEATTVRFLMGGAPHMPNITPPQRLAAQDVLTKVNDAIAVANAPEAPKKGGKKADAA